LYPPPVSDLFGDFKRADFNRINILCMLLELVYGLISNSIGLISDAAHMLFDSTALGVGIYASYKATLPANKKFSFG